MTDYRLSDSDANAYLDLIGVRKTNPSLQLLQEIISKTIKVIPFQNITMLDSERRRPTFDEINHLMLSGIGGICTVRNPFIHQLLVNLGFDAKMVASTMKQPNCHITIIVSINDALWWCDPGNGFPYFSIIRLGDESVKAHPFLEYRLVDVEGRWEMQHRRNENEWFTNYHFTTEFVDLEYFDEMYNSHYTVPAYGPFLTGLRLNKWTEDDGLILRNNTATNSSHIQILNDEGDFEKWVNQNLSPLSTNDLLGSNKDIAKIWSVIQ